MTDWTATPPTEPGWYWHKVPGFDGVDVLLLRRSGGRKNGVLETKGWLIRGGMFAGDLWLGPIMEPRPPKEKP